ncbi:hypothetical protein BKA93DRAFT_238950 [Sparassis latifolia]
MLTAWIVMVSRTGRYRTIIHTGFAVWAVGCGCLSTVTDRTSKGLLVFFMLLAGLGPGQVGEIACLPSKQLYFNCRHCKQQPWLHKPECPDGFVRRHRRTECTTIHCS